MSSVLYAGAISYCYLGANLLRKGRSRPEEGACIDLLHGIMGSVLRADDSPLDVELVSISTLCTGVRPEPSRDLLGMGSALYAGIRLEALL